MLRIRKFYAKDIEKVKKDLDITEMVIYIDYVNRVNQSGRAYKVLPYRFSVKGYTHYIQVDRSAAELGLSRSKWREETRKIIMHELRHLWQYKHNKYPDPVGTEEYKLYKNKKIKVDDLPWEKDCRAYEEEYHRISS